MMIWFQLGLVAALVAGGLFVVHTYNSAIADKEAAEQRASVAEEAASNSALAVKKLQEMGQLSDKLGKKTKQEADDERRRAGAMEEELVRLANRESAVRDWSAAPVPDSVRGMRRASAGVPDPRGVLGADRPALPNVGANDAGRDERRVAP